MAIDDPIKMQKKTVEIEGGRNLYQYSFTVASDEAPAADDKNASAGNFETESEANG